MLVVSYVFGIATVYATLGYIAATTTVMFGQWMASPWLIGFIALLFVYLAFSMFGFYEIYVPRFMQQRDQVKVRGSFVQSFLFGMVSGSVASPCLTPALALLLGFVAKQGNPIVGFFTLFFFALGMGMLLLIVGSFSGVISALPRAGEWMIEIKKFFGFVLLGFALSFIKPFFPHTIVMVLYGILLGVVVGYYLLKVKATFLSK